MRGLIFIVSVGLLTLGSTQAQAIGSCSVFVKLKSYDGDSKMVTVEVDKREKERRFFPKPEGSPATSKFPERCKTSIMRAKSFAVTPTGGRMSVTQVRENFSSKMLNETDNPEWVGKQFQGLIEGKTTVMILLRQPPGQKDADYAVTTVYMPITEVETAEIARLEAQAIEE